GRGERRTVTTRRCRKGRGNCPGAPPQGTVLTHVDPRRARRQMRRMRLGFHPRGDGIERAEYLGMNMISGHTPGRQAGGQLAQERRGAAQIELALPRNANLVEGRNRQVPGSVEIDTPLVIWSWPAVLDIVVAVLQFLQQSTRLVPERMLLAIARSVEPPNWVA